MVTPAFFKPGLAAFGALLELFLKLSTLTTIPQLRDFNVLKRLSEVDNVAADNLASSLPKIVCNKIRLREYLQF